MGQRISQPSQHGPLAECLFDSESSEEDQETSAGKTEAVTSCLDHGWLNPADEPTREETLDVSQALSHQQQLHGITLHYKGEPTTARLYTDGSKRHGRGGEEYTTEPFGRPSAYTDLSSCTVPRLSPVPWPSNWLRREKRWS